MRKVFIIGLVSVVSSTAFAQMDNVVEVENNYRPVVKDANKINSLPEIEQTNVNHYNVNYTTTAVPTTNYVFQPMWAAKNEQLIRSDKKGFATAAYGIDNNVLGRIAYGFDLSKDDELNLDFSSRGHNSEIDNINGTSKWMSRFFTNRFKAGYEHRFDSSSSLLLDASYGTDVFNYQSPTAGLGYTDKQQNDLVNVNAELTPYSFGNFGIGASVGFSMFNQKYVTSLVDQAKEVGVSGSITPSYQLNDDASIDLEACIDYTNYNMAGFDDGLTFNYTPHFYWKSDAVDLKAGVYVDQDLHIAPDVDVIFHLHPSFDLYLQAEGGRVYNDFKRFAQMTPYWCLNATEAGFDDQFDQLRAQGGIRMKPIEGLYADLSAGYDISKDRAEIADFLMDRTTNPTYSPILFADGTNFYVNANVKYNYKNRFMADLNGRYNHWTTDFKPTAYAGAYIVNWDQILWRPQVELDCSIKVKPIEQLTIGADFLFESFQKKSNRYERPNTVDLGATISYTFPFRLTLYAKGDNLLNQKYDHYTMYRSPGINFLAGAAITF